MADRYYGYQYGTNPRKLSQENVAIRNTYSRNAKNDEYEVVEDSRKKAPKKRNDKPSNEINATSKQKKEHNNVEFEQKSTTVVRSDKNIKIKLKVVLYLITGFSVLFAISYQNSLINESFNKKEQYKKEMEALSKTNQQLEVNIENNLNLKNVEQVAKERLGMQKLNNNQKIYVNLPKQDYVAPASEQIIMEEDTGFFDRIIKSFKK